MVWLNWWGVNKIVGGGFDSRAPHFGLLAQLVERLVYTQLVAGSSPARSTGAWYGSALLSFVACCGVCYGVGARC